MHMMQFPDGSVTGLLNTDRVTEPTRKALRDRLERETLAPGAAPGATRFFTADEFQTVRAVCDRLIPQADRPVRVDIAGAIDRRLADGRGDGWRYAVMPPDGEAYRMGFRGLDESAGQASGRRFHELELVDQCRLIAAAQRDEVSGGAWERLAPRRFVEELLAEACEVYYSNPHSQEEIGYVGMADARGWPDVGLNQLAPHEPRALGRPE